MAILKSSLEFVIIEKMFCGFREKQVVVIVKSSLLFGYLEQQFVVIMKSSSCNVTLEKWYLRPTLTVWVSCSFAVTKYLF